MYAASTKCQDACVFDIEELCVFSLTNADATAHYDMTLL